RPPSRRWKERPSRRKSRSKARISRRRRRARTSRPRTRRLRNEFRRPASPGQGRSSPRGEGHAPAPASHTAEPLRDRAAGSHLPRDAPARQGLRDLGRGRSRGPRKTPAETRPTGGRPADRRRFREVPQRIQIHLGSQSSPRERRGTCRGRPRLASGDPTAAPSEGLPRDQARIPRRRGPRVPGKSDQSAPRANGGGGDDGWSVGRASFEGAARTAAGIDKLLGSGRVAVAMRITVAKASEAALAKVADAGGEVVLPAAAGK